MSVHYKFKSTLHFDTITFDGLHISVADLKREIVQQKRLGKIIDFDLQITNAQNKEEYKDDNFLIPKNTTLIISRIPIAHPNKKGWDPSADNPNSSAPTIKPDNLNMDLFKMQGTEEDKIQAMMMQSTADYDPKTYHRIKGQSQVGEVPASYRCNKCKRGGHWIKNCSFTTGKEQFEVKRTTGIPRSFRGKPEISIEPETSQYLLSTEKEQEIPEDLICGICRNIFVDAVMIPCCGSSFCDDCVRTSLLESEDSECPDCKEKNCSPGSLIPNRFLRNSVNVFKNETGYKIGSFKSVGKTTPAVEKKEELVPPEEEQEETNEMEVVKEEEKLSETSKIEEQTVLPTIAATNNVELPKTEKEKPDSVKKKEKDKSDSDYEDNITIKMPQKLSESTSIISDTTKEQASPSPSSSYIHKSHGNNVTQHHEPNYAYKSDQDMKHHTSYSNKNDNIKPQNERSLLPTPIGNHHKYQNHNLGDQREKLVLNPEHRIGLYKPTYMQMPRLPTMLHMGSYNNGYNNMPHRPPINFGPYQNPPVHQMNTSYMPTGNINLNPSQTFQSTNLASIYQGVAAKVGTGLIDDPLEAFNRIMKEKEKQKIDRRRSPGHHRSRSPPRLRHRFKSPVYNRERGSSRDMNMKEKRPRSRERKREYSYERRTGGRVIRHSSHGSHSPSDKKKRYVHRRSPTPPKLEHKQRTRERSLTRPYGAKLETLEPPPPGFESLQIESLAENDINRNSRAMDPDINRNLEDHFLPRKRQRHYSKTLDVNTDRDQNRSRSLTPPPAKSKMPKTYQAESTGICEGSPKTPDRKENDFNKIDKNQNDQLLYGESEINAEKSHEHVESDGNMGKENNIKNNLQQKDRKKKKKVKSERKKNKKDKKDKDKKDKVKKCYSESAENSPEKSSGVNNVDQCDESNEYHHHSNSLIQSLSECIQKSDSILNIDHEDMGELTDIQKSKWELDDNNLALDPCRKITCNKIQENSEITSDVLRKAENAIFAKAINAIRPVEFKVVLDTKRSSKDKTTVTIKSDHKDRSHSPKNVINKSVKERLGNKVVDERNYSSDRSRNRSGRDDSARSSNDDRYKYNQANYSSNTSSRQRKDTVSKERSLKPERKFDDRRVRKSSTEREIINIPQKEAHFSESNKYKSQYKDNTRTSMGTTKSEKRNYDSDRSSYRTHEKAGGESRLIASIASRPSRPCRPDNPFRKFDENMSSNKVPKFESSIKSSRELTPQSPDQAEHKKRKDKKLKKIKSLKRSPSSDSDRSDKRRDLKSKKKSKVLKKKKKSRK